MLSQASLSSMAIINIFLIPVFGLKIYCKRNGITIGIDLKTLYYYILITVLNLLTTHIFVNIVEAIISDTIYLETTKYTAIALFSCVLLPFIIETIKTFFKADVFISLRKKEGTKTNEK